MIAPFKSRAAFFHMNYLDSKMFLIYTLYLEGGKADDIAIGLVPGNISLRADPAHPSIFSDDSRANQRPQPAHADARNRENSRSKELSHLEGLEPPVPWGR